MAINRSLCLLMTEDLIARFNTLDSVFSSVKQRLPHLWDSPQFQVLVKELDKIQAKMEQPRYYVGFLGRSQVGKSSTLNSVLRPRRGEEPCTGGQGAPATSTVTRIHRKLKGESSNGDAHTCNLRYMTPNQFMERRRSLCQLLGFEPTDPDSSLRSQIETLLAREASEPEHGASTAHVDKLEDYKYFHKLLVTYQSNNSLVTDPPKEEVGEFARRSDYTNHPRTQDPWPFLMLREVEIGYHTEEISEKIELIDLPGLGARMASDDELTKAFLPNLDGALIFQSSEQVAAKEAYDLLSSLRKLFPRLKGRVWMVITKFDSLSQVSLGYDSTTSILDNIQKTMADNKIPLEQVVLVGNEFHRTLLNPDGTLSRPTADNFRLTLNLRVDESGEPILPKPFERHPDLKGSFRDVIEDGGIERIREIIGRTLAEEVEREVREEVGDRLRRLHANLGKQVEAAKVASRMDGNSFKKILGWKVHLQFIEQRLDEERSIVETPFDSLTKQVGELFESLCPDNYKITPERLPQHHLDYVKVLSEHTYDRSRIETLTVLYDAIGDLVAQGESGIGKVRIATLESPVLAWRNLQDGDLADLGWYKAAIDEYNRPPLFIPNESSNLRDRQYREIMLRKIESVGQRLAFIVVQRIRMHLWELIEQLALIDGNQTHTDSVDDGAFDEILAVLA